MENLKHKDEYTIAREHQTKSQEHENTKTKRAGKK
jgi:hypothetical protein